MVVGALGAAAWAGCTDDPPAVIPGRGQLLLPGELPDGLELRYVGDAVSRIDDTRAVDLYEDGDHRILLARGTQGAATSAGRPGPVLASGYPSQLDADDGLAGTPNLVARVLGVPAVLWGAPAERLVSMADRLAGPGPLPTPTGHLDPSWRASVRSRTFMVTSGRRAGWITARTVLAGEAAVLRAMFVDDPEAALRAEPSVLDRARLPAPTPTSVRDRPAWLGSIRTDAVLVVGGEPGIVLFMPMEEGGLAMDDFLAVAERLRLVTEAEAQSVADELDAHFRRESRSTPTIRTPSPPSSAP